jgi:hypothetical protein
MSTLRLGQGVFDREVGRVDDAERGCVVAVGGKKFVAEDGRKY